MPYLSFEKETKRQIFDFKDLLSEFTYTTVNIFKAELYSTVHVKHESILTNEFGA